MKHYNWSQAYEARKNLSKEQEERVFETQCLEAFLLTGEQLDEIREIFRVQLEKEGHKDRAMATEQVIDYLYQIRKDEYDKLGEIESIRWSYFYSNSLITIAEIIDAVNNGNEERLKERLESLPWGDSNTGDQISYNATRFVYWILSDEDRLKYKEIFFNQIKKSNMSLGSEEKANEIMQRMESMEGLESLKEHNDDERKLIDEKVKEKQGQPQ